MIVSIGAVCACSHRVDFWLQSPSQSLSVAAIIDSRPFARFVIVFIELICDCSHRLELCLHSSSRFVIQIGSLSSEFVTVIIESDCACQLYIESVFACLGIIESICDCTTVIETIRDQIVVLIIESVRDCYH